ncbi:hypothetical protein, partial [Limnofasciculus baicalensis]|nr:hypothetical protein [Limnofasciculus baicalensis BBK-W-15]
MRQSLLISLVTLLALLVGGCPANQENPTAVGGSPSPNPQATPASPTTPPTKVASSNVKLPPKPDNQLAVSGLTQTLPPEEQLKRATKGRVDPFSLISDIKPIKTVVPNPEGAGNNQSEPIRVVPPTPPSAPPPRNQSGGGNRSSGNQSIRTIRPNVLPSQPRGPFRPINLRPQSVTASKPTPNTRRNTTPKPTPKPTPKLTIVIKPSPSTTQVSIPPTPPLPPPPKFIPDLPKLPEPTLAKGIEVTGVIEIAGVPQAILKAPNES